MRLVIPNYDIPDVTFALYDGLRTESATSVIIIVIRSINVLCII